MDWTKLFEFVENHGAKEWSVVSGAPVATLLLFCAAVVASWMAWQFVLKARFQGKIDGQEKKIELLDKELEIANSNFKKLHDYCRNKVPHFPQDVISVIGDEDMYFLIEDLVKRNKVALKFDPKDITAEDLARIKPSTLDVSLTANYTALQTFGVAKIVTDPSSGEVYATGTATTAAAHDQRPTALGIKPYLDCWPSGPTKHSDDN